MNMRAFKLAASPKSVRTIDKAIVLSIIEHYEKKLKSVRLELRHTKSTADYYYKYFEEHL